MRIGRAASLLLAAVLLWARMTLAVPAHDAGADAQAAFLGDADADAAVETDAESADAGADVDSEDAGTAQAAPVASASASAPAAPREIPEGSPVRLHEERVFAIRAPRAGLTPEERARRASNALERAFDETDFDDARLDESQPGLAVVLVGNRPIAELTQEDADAAGDASLHAHAAGVAQNVRDALKKERFRRDLSKRVFSWSLVVLSALIAFLVLRRVRELAVSARSWVTDHPDRLPALRVGSVEVMRPAAFQGVIRVGVWLIERALELTLLYLWLVFVLSRFESTKDMGGKITDAILKPLGALFGRLAMSLPLLIAAAIAVVVLFSLVRFIRLFFHSVEVGETQLAWLPPDLAPATSTVARLGLVIAAVAFGAPLVTGTEEGASARAGMVILGALGVALVPLFAAMTVGFATVFWRRIRVGDFVSFDGRQGRVAGLTLLEVRVHDGEGSELRIPHLLTLMRPLRVLGAYPLATFEVVVDPKASQDRVRKVLTAAAASKHGDPRVKLLAIDANGARYEIAAKRVFDEEEPATRVTRALQEAGIELGHTSR